MRILLGLGLLILCFGSLFGASHLVETDSALATALVVSGVVTAALCGAVMKY